MKNGKKHLFLGFFFALLLITGLTVGNLKKPQNTKSHAASGSTTLVLTPATVSKQIGDAFDLDLMVNPGTNLVSFIKFQIAFDSTKVAFVATNPFTLNSAEFPIKVEGPVINAESIGESVSVGADPTKVIQKTTKVGTLHFTALSNTNGTPATISFTSLTQALSAGASDSARISVLSGTTPATITIGGSSQITPSTTPNLTPTLTPEPTGNDKASTATFTILLHGVGAGGDNPNPGGNSLSNKSPLHPQRDLQVLLFDTSNKLVASISGAINFDAGSGAFKGSVDLGSNIKKGNYSVKVKTDRYLRKLIPGAQEITPLKDNPITQVSLVAGDTNGDNLVNILDYAAFLDCGYGALNPLPVDDANSIFNKNVCQIHTPAVNIDIDDNGIVDSADYNLFLRELSVENGD
ncbi:MAG TPA: hypothetical protein VLG67_05430 [Candidatus Saccharimonadales bacterium]|nr:hypothetical protein [Candidatus Saccharimonadales bacterium]